MIECEHGGSTETCVDCLVDVIISQEGHIQKVEAERDALLARVAELEGHNLEYALHEQKLQEAITRIDTLSRYDNHPRSRSARDAAIKDAVELGEGK